MVEEELHQVPPRHCWRGGLASNKLNTCSTVSTSGASSGASGLRLDDQWYVKAQPGSVPY